MEPNIDTTLSASPQPQVQIVGIKESLPWLLIIFWLAFALTLATTIYFFLRASSLQKQLSTTSSPNPFSSQITPIVPSPTTSPSRSATPQLYPDWKVLDSRDSQGTMRFAYDNQVYSDFLLQYPPSCTRNDLILHCTLPHGNFTLIVNASGHGGGEGDFTVIKKNEAIDIVAGSGSLRETRDNTNNLVFGTYWINRTDKLTQSPIFGFEFTNVPYEDLIEFEKLFKQIISTLVFVEK